eukprot:3937985-Rhodomonas_salina.4
MHPARSRLRTLRCLKPRPRALCNRIRMHALHPAARAVPPPKHQQLPSARRHAVPHPPRGHLPARRRAQVAPPPGRDRVGQEVTGSTPRCVPAQHKHLPLPKRHGEACSRRRGAGAGRTSEVLPSAGRGEVRVEIAEQRAPLPSPAKHPHAPIARAHAMPPAQRRRVSHRRLAEVGPGARESVEGTEIACRCPRALFVLQASEHIQCLVQPCHRVQGAGARRGCGR